MGERKVINKYIPADFDPSLVPRGKKLSSKDGTVPVRMMLPFSLQCNTCRSFLYRGRKFNSKKEPMGGPDGTYLGITRWRFYIKCTQCSRPITFLTDPKNTDYEMESGGTRNFEAKRENKIAEEKAEAEKEELEKLDPMKALENRVLDSQREIADLDNLEEIKAMNARHVKLLSAAGNAFDADAKSVLLALEAKELHNAMVNNKAPDGELLSEQDEALIKSIRFGKNVSQQSTIRRLDEADEKRAEEQRKKGIAALEEQHQQLLMKAQATKMTATATMPTIIVKRKKASVEGSSKKAKVEPMAISEQPEGLAGLLGGYSSDSE